MERKITVPEDQVPFLVSSGELGARLENLRLALQREQIDLALITHVADLFYFTGTVQNGVLAAPAESEPILFAGKSPSRARAESPLADVRPQVKPEAMAREIAGRTGRSVGRLGLNLDTLPAAPYLRLTKAFGGAEVADVSPLVRKIRMVKSAWEIGQIGEAAAQVLPIFERMGEIFRPGMPEVEVSAEIEKRLRVTGHPGMVRVRRPGQEFAMLVVSAGASAAYPVHLDGPIGFTGLFPCAAPGAGRRVIREGDTFMADIVSYHNGYLADHARTFAAGHAGGQTLLAHDFCRDVLREIAARLVPGAICGQIFDEVAAYARKVGEPEGFMGFGENRVRFFGHGVGLELDEMPVLAHGFDTRLEEGMILAVEPKAFSPAYGPAGLENTYLITKDGAKPLCPAPEEIITL